MIEGSVTNLRGLAMLRLSETGQVGAGTITDDTGGGGTTSWSYATAVPCRVDPLTGSEGRVAERLSDLSTHLITLPPETSIAPASRFRVVGAATYEVTAVRAATGERMRFVEAVQVT